MTITTAATFNVWQGQRGAQLVGNIEAALEAMNHPHVLALQEALHLDRDIAGYTRIHAEGLEFSSRFNQSTQLLVRKDSVILHGSKARQVNGPYWLGPKQGVKQPPRVFIRATYSLASDPARTRFDAFAIHRTPGGPNPHIAANARSWAAEDRFIEGWSDARAEKHGHIQLWLGDHNGRRGDKGPLSLQDLARRMGNAQLAIKGIDGAIVRDARGSSRKLLRKFGSDGHRPVLTRVNSLGTRRG